MNLERLSKVLVAPHISEKSTRVADAHKQFVFTVARTATKAEVKQAVEKLFNVKVGDVRVCNVKGKTKRFGAMMGRRVHRKKAYVTLQAGYDLDFAGAQ